MGQSTEVRASQTYYVERVGAPSGFPLVEEKYTIVSYGYGDNEAQARRDLKTYIDLYTCASVGGRGGFVAVRKCEPQSEVIIEVVPKRKGLISRLIDWVTSLI